MALPPLPDTLSPIPAEAEVLPPAEVVPEASVRFPITWFLANAPGPLQCRALVDVAKLAPLPANAPALVYSHKPGLLLAIRQHVDGSWNTRMLVAPRSDESELASVGTILAVRRLLELGWEGDTPTLHLARRLLFRLLAEDDDPRFLFELADEATDSDLVHRGRLILREAAASVLAQYGYETDPRLRGCAHRILQRVGDFLDGPLAESPWIRQGNRQMLSPEASPPSIHLLHMLAFMPQFRTEHTHVMDALYQYVSRPLTAHSLQQLVGANVVSQPHLVLGDPIATRGIVDGDVAFALYWLELMARLGFLRRNENWSRLYERFVGECDRDHVWRPAKGSRELPTTSSQAWPNYPLHTEPLPNGIAADVTFRIGLIARLSGRTIELV